LFGGSGALLDRLSGLAPGSDGADSADGMVGGLVMALPDAVGTLWQGVGTLALGIFATVILVSEGPRMWQASLRPLTHDRRVRVGLMGGVAWRTLVAYARGTVIVALVDAVGIGVGVAVVGVPLAVPIGALVFFSSFVPLIGALVSGFAAVLVALAWGGITPALLVLAIVLVVQQLEGQVLDPLIQARMVRLHPLAVMLSITVGTLIAGLAGAMLAVPVVSVAKALLQMRGAAGLADELPSGSSASEAWENAVPNDAVPEDAVTDDAVPDESVADKAVLSEP